MASQTKHLAELRGKNDDDLQKQLVDRRKELLDLRFSHATGALENSARMGSVKREIARIRTVLTERSRTAAAASKQA